MITGWLVGILIMAFFGNPHITGSRIYFIPKKSPEMKGLGDGNLQSQIELWRKQTRGKQKLMGNTEGNSANPRKQQNM